MRIVCIGDSLTYGFGVMKKHTWIEILKDSLDGLELINKGINGDTTSGMLCRSYEDIVLNYPDKVIIMGGTNDFIAGYTVERVLENIIELVKEAREHQIEPIIGIEIPVEPIMACKIWAQGVDYKRINENIKNYREKIIYYCNEKGYKYIDFYKYFIENLKKNTGSRYYTDGIHPTYQGHKIMAKSAKDVLQDII